MKRVVLATSGSLGDLHPYIAIGLDLKRRGHKVTIATSKAYRRNVENEGLAFHHVRPDVAPPLYSQEVFRRANDLRTGAKYLVSEMVMPFIGDMYEDLMAVCSGADLLVIHPVMFAAPLVAEKLRIKWLSVVLAPGGFVSVYDMPLLPPLSWLHPLRKLGPLPNRWLLHLLYRGTRSWGKPVQDFRACVGLPPAEKHPLHSGMYSPFGTLACFSELLGSPQADWPINTHTTGFVFYDKHEHREELDPELERFVSAGDPPVVFTLGSSAVRDAGNFYQASFDAVTRINARAVFLIGEEAGNRPHGDIPHNVLVSDYAPYSKLFPKAAAVVHQGGIGTTAQTLRAGVPMLVVPFLYDQPDNAFRVEKLGVARVIRRDAYAADVAAKHLKTLLDDPRYRARAQAAATQIRTEDGVANARRVIERLLRAERESGDGLEHEFALPSAL